MARKIDDYFKTQKSAEFAVIQQQPKKANDAFYEDCESEHRCSSECTVEKDNLKIKINETKETIKKIEDAIISCRSIIVEKNFEIENLQKRLPEDSNPVSNDAPELMYTSYSNVFSCEQTTQLRSIGTSARNDSTFIIYAIRCLYAENIDSVRNKSACGKKVKRGEKQKTMMTPEKKKTIENIFDERMRGSGLSILEQNFRKKQLNKLIKDALANITKSLDSRNAVNEACRQLTYDD